MLQTRTIAAVAFVALAAVAALWQLSADDPEAATHAAASPVPDLAKLSIDELAVTPPGGEPIVLANTDAGWRMTAPAEDDADDAAVSRAVESLGKARFDDRPAALSRKSWARLGVTDDEAVTLAPRAGGEHVVTLKMSKDGQYVRVGDGVEVYRAYDLQPALLNREARMWRDRSLFEIPRDQIGQVSVTAGDRTVTAERIPPGEDGGQDQWKLVGGDFELDPAVPIAIATRMQSLNADDFADGVDLAQAGLADPAMRVTVTTEDGTEHTLLVGAEVGEARYVGKPGSDRVWTLANASLDYFAREPVQWQDKTIARVTPDEVESIELRKGREKRRVGPDDEDWEKLSGALQNFRGTMIATDVTRIDNPTATAIYTLKGGKKITVRIGEQREDKTWYVAPSTRKDVLVVADYLVKPLLAAP